jgi:Ca2+-binding RTX toxin-like protein
VTGFTGKQKADTANALTGKLIGFKGGTVALLQDTIGDSFVGSGGNDTVVSASGKDTISGGNGNDNLTGGAGDDRVDGGKGNDLLKGGAGTDTILGGANDDTIALFQGEEADNVDGGSGTDLLNLSGLTTDTASVNLTTGVWSTSVSAATKTIVGIENVTGGGAAETLTGNALANSLNGNGGDDILDGGTGNDTLTGGAGNDRLIGATGTDSLNAGAGDDTVVLAQGEFGDSINGGADTDLVDFSGLTTASATVDLAAGTWSTSASATVGTLTAIEDVTGGAAADILKGNASANHLDGGGGADLLQGVGGLDNILGGDGNDTIVIAQGDAADNVDGGAGTDFLDLSGLTTDTVTLDLGAGKWSTSASAAVVDISGIETIVSGDGDDRLTGGTAGENISGGAGADAIGGGTGDDTLGGGDGDDVIGGGAGADAVNGGDGNDTFAINAGDIAVGDQVDGGAGSNRLLFGSEAAAALTLDIRALVFASIDSFEFSEFADAAKTAAVLASQMAGIAAIDGNLGAADQLRISMGAVATLDLGSLTFTDWNTATTEKDRILVVGNAAAENIKGSTGSDSLLGNNGRDTLDGGLAKDILKGGNGDDVYFVDAAGEAVEKAGQGTDWVNATVSLRLGANLENLKLLGTTNLNGTGNGLANRITGNAGNNRLNGGLGADTMTGGNGNDIYVFATGDKVIEKSSQGIDTIKTALSHTLEGNVEKLVLTGSANVNGNGNGLANTLTGNAGNNILNGKLGADTMAGGAGNDTYIFAAGDKVVEKSGKGIDTLKTALSHTLEANVEKLILTGKGNVSGTGNGLANTLTGNAGANTLDGKLGADTMAGGGGNDTYVFGKGDKIVEGLGKGIDTEKSALTHTLEKNVEKLILTGTGNINGTGNGLANTLTGNAGANALDGKAGNDVLIGGAGADKFVFDTALSATANVDTIKDYDTVADQIRLDNAVFTDLVAGNLSTSAFHVGTAAADATDRIVYNSTTGALYFDADGKGGEAQVKFAVMTGLPFLNALDFVVI